MSVDEYWYNANYGKVDFFTIFFFNDTATTEIYTLSLHDALPISPELAGEANITAFEEKQAFKLQNLKYCQHNPILGKIIKSAPHRQIFETTRHIISIGKGVTLF